MSGNDGLQPPYPPEVSRRLQECLSFGNTGIIELLPGDRVIKSPHPQECTSEKRRQTSQLRREIEIYNRLPTSHDRLIRMLDHSVDLANANQLDGSIVFEYMPNGSLSSYLESDINISIHQRLQWGVEAAEAVALLHSYKIIHADIKPQNMLLDKRLGLKLIDMSGSSIDGKRPLTLESTSFFLPRNMTAPMPCSVLTDLFALGSSIYQIITRALPYGEIDNDEVEKRYARKEFPSTLGIPYGNIIRGCWMCDFDSAEAVLDALKHEMRLHTNRHRWFSMSFFSQLLYNCCSYREAR